MRKLREILRLKHELGLRPREIARACGISPTTLYEYQARLESSGVGWPLPEGWDDRALEDAVFGARDVERGPRRAFPAMVDIHRELRARRGVTLRLLWEEYRAEHPEGYAYTQFCEHYARWRRGLEPSLRQEHRAGEKLFVDWAGQTIEVGSSSRAYLFVAVMGASNYTFAKAFADMRSDSWIRAHIDAFEFLGGVPAITVPDNARTAVSRACRYDPEHNPAYAEMAEHYGTAILAARPAKPRDKAKVEVAVLHAERRILAVLRHRRLLSLEELNAAIAALLAELNARPFQKIPGSRSEAFAQIDRPALGPLPATRHEIGQWRTARVNIDYHVEIDGHFYSVPYRLVNRRVEARLSATGVEILHEGKRVALHARSQERARATTLEEHRPESHRRHLDWTPGRLIGWAGAEVGARCAAAARRILADKPHPEQGYRACLGLMRLARAYGKERVEAACARALALDVCTYRSIASMLGSGLDRQRDVQEGATASSPGHANIRGGHYYRERADGGSQGHVA